MSSCVGGNTLNFYNDNDEAQELILDEDRLTYRAGRYVLLKPHDIPNLIDIDITTMKTLSSNSTTRVP